MADEFKVAAINWLLREGCCDWMAQDTSGSLRSLAERGIDWEKSQTPDFSDDTMINDGDSFNGATFAGGISATIVPVGSRIFRDEFTFVVDTNDDSDFQFGNRPGLTMEQAIVEIVEVGESIGEAGWRERFADRWAFEDERTAKFRAKLLAEREAASR